MANLAAAVTGIFLWVLLKQARKTYAGIGMGITAAGVLLLLAASRSLREEFFDVFRGVWGSLQEGPAEVTGAGILLAILLIWIGFFFEFVLHAHGILYLVITFLLLLAPLLGHTPGSGSVFLMTVFQLVFWTMTGARKLASKNKDLLKNKISIGLFLGFAGIFFIAFLIVSFQGEGLYQAAYGAEGVLQRTVKQITGLDLNASDGRVSRGNLYPTGREQLELVTEEMPTETLYLRGFSGGDYEGGEWQEDRDEEIYALMEENSLHWGQWESWIPGIYESLYFVMNQNMKGMEEGVSDRVLAVRYLNGWRGDWYAPYYSMWSRNNQRYAEDLYGFRYFQQDEMDIRWDNIQTFFADNGDMYQEVQAAYEKEAVGVYTQVPVEEIPRLTDLCRENPMEDLDHITSFILYTLQSNTSYTRTPGMFPFNEDPVEYFLFQGKEGYCQHFASAAVLMYRLYGIPARYASGYAVSPSDFEQQEDGTWRAVVTDVSAHAWPEIFIHDYGWTPVEVTPSGNGDSVHYPGFDAQMFQEIVADREWNMAVPSLQNREQEKEEEVQEAENAGSLSETDWKIPGKLAGFGGAALAVLCAILYRSYKKRDLWIRKGGMGRLFDQLLFDLHFSGRMKSYQGWEEDFGQKLAEEIPAVSEEEAEQIVRTAREAAYGNPEEFSGENYQAAYTGCLKIRSYILSKIPATRRFLYYLRVSFRQFSL